MNYPLSVSILDLNIEIIENILEYLDDIDVVNLYKTCKHLYILRYDYKWKRFYNMKTIYVLEKEDKNIFKNITKLIVNKSISDLGIYKFATELIFSDSYNKIVNIPESVTNLTFGKNYNHPTNIPNSVTHLTF